MALKGEFIVRTAILVAIFLVLSNPSWGGFINSGKLHSICQNKNTYEQDFCVAYIIGLWDGQEIGWRGLLGSDPIVCFSGEADVDEIVNIVVSWLDRGRNYRTGPTVAVAALALSNAYPCG
jgi:hypothetical protein